MILITKIKTIYRSVTVRAAEAMRKNAGALEAVNNHLPAFLTVAAAWTAEMSLPLLFGICWENDLRTDVANAARERILKELAGMEGFEDLISETDSSIRTAVQEIFTELRSLERQGIYTYRNEFRAKMDQFINLVLEKAWKDLEPKIADTQKKARIKAWIGNLQGKLKGVDEIQQRAADILRENVREILGDFNGKCEDHLGQSIPGEIEGEGADKAMHELAETIVEKIMDRELDFEVAMGQVAAEIGNSKILDAEGKEKLITDLLKESRTNDGGTGLEKLFADFRKDFLEPGPGTLAMPKKTDIKTLDRTKRAGHVDSQTKKGGKTDAES